MTKRLTREDSLGHWIKYGREAFARGLSLQEARTASGCWNDRNLAAIQIGYGEAQCKQALDGKPLFVATSPEKEH